MLTRLEHNASHLSSLLVDFGARDKVAKVLMYGSRIIVWRALSQGHTSRAAAWKALGAMACDARRINRLGSSVHTLPPLLNALRGGANGASCYANLPALVRHALTLGNAADVFYYGCDNVPLLADLGLIKLSSATSAWLYDVVGTWAWVVSVVAWLFHDWVVLQQLQRRVRVLQRASASVAEDDIRDAKRKVWRHQLSLVASVADGALAVAFLNDGLCSSQGIGMLGVTNAVISLYLKWTADKPKQA